jgi:hypothetical protein
VVPVPIDGGTWAAAREPALGRAGDRNRASTLARASRGCVPGTGVGELEWINVGGGVVVGAGSWIPTAFHVSNTR